MLKAMPHHQRPREKFLQLGPQSLTDAELLALFFRTGVQGHSAIDLGQQLINQHDNLANILKLSKKSFCQTKGLGESKYIQLQAVKEIIARCQIHSLSENPVFNQPQQVKDFLTAKLGFLHREVFAVLFLDNQHQLIQFEIMFEGSLAEAQVYPREIAKRALECDAAAIILAHNHPSGNPQPSDDDIQLTRHIKKSLDLIDIRVLDHFIVAKSHLVSLAERGDM
jgi:DNA repair protein RadC